jgi:predicted DNA-binding transcriptional regulator AlpA
MQENFRFLNEVETSQITGLSVQTLRNWRSQRRGIPYSKAGRAVRYKFQDIFNYMEQRKIKTAN